jgi:hypothetical protein
MMHNSRAARELHHPLSPGLLLATSGISSTLGNSDMAFSFPCIFEEFPRHVGSGGEEVNISCQAAVSLSCESLSIALSLNGSHQPREARCWTLLRA